MTENDALRNLQLEELAILVDIQKFCDENDINWFLIGGTALGSARHRGFIPWDDDLDIGMLRPDYDKFLTLAKKGLPFNLRLDEAVSTDGCAITFAKVCRKGTVYRTRSTMVSGYDQGIFVDIFPYDAIVDSGAGRFFQIGNAWLCMYLLYALYAPEGEEPVRTLSERIKRFMKISLGKLLGGFFSPKMLMAQFERSIVSREIIPNYNYMTLSAPKGKGIPVTSILPYASSEFEGFQFPVPSCLESYLRYEYGDWNKIPVESQRHTHMPLEIVFSDGEAWKR